MQIKFEESKFSVLFQDKCHDSVVLKNETFPGMVEELEFLIKRIDSWRVCNRRPELNISSSCDDVYFKKIIREKTGLKHADCEVIVQGGSICRICLSVDCLLDRAVDRENHKERASQVSPVSEEIAKLEVIGRKIYSLRRQSVQMNTTPKSKAKLAMLRNMQAVSSENVDKNT